MDRALELHFGKSHIERSKMEKNLEEMYLFVEVESHCRLNILK
jgi:hypothetical protein